MLSSSGSSPVLVLDRPRCRRVQGLVICSMALALTALLAGGLSPWPLGVAVAFVVACGFRECRRASPSAPGFISRLVVLRDGRFQIGLAGTAGPVVPADLVSSWHLPGVAVGLAFAGGSSGRVEMVLFRDRVPAADWRRLAARLRHPPLAATPAR